MERELIIKALECCFDGDCYPCPYAEIGAGCRDKNSENALALINSQEQRIKKLTEENERLRGILLQFTDIVHKWGNKHGYDTSEISLVPILNEESAIKKQIEAETLKKYKSAIIEYYSKPKYQPTKEHPIKHTQIEHLFAVIDQIAKEMKGEKK